MIQLVRLMHGMGGELRFGRAPAAGEKGHTAKDSDGQAEKKGFHLWTF
jgi:hypothetical protein